MQETGNKLNNPYSLSIRFHTDGFSFFICNPQSEKNFLKKDIPVTDSTLLPQILSDSLKNYPPLQERKYTVISALFNGPVCHVPLELFHKERRKTLYEMICSLPENENVHYNILPRLEVAELFAIPQAVEQILLRTFPTIHFYAQNAMVLERSVQHAPQTEEKKLWVYFYKKRIFIFQYKEKKLTFANEFTVATAKDALYYILNVWKMLEMDSRTDSCILIQPENSPQQTVEELSHYLLHIQIADMQDWFGKAPLTQVKEIPFDILSLLLNGF